MNNLIDTHTLIWFLNGDDDLSDRAKKIIEESDAVNFVSIASLWEMAIKISLGKLELKRHFAEILVQIEKFYQLLLKTHLYYQICHFTIEILSIGL